MANLFQPEIAHDTVAQRRVRQWLAALRSGDHPQATGSLRTPDGFCCLGVACDLFDETTWRWSDKRANWSYLGATIDLPRPVMDAYRLRSPNGDYVKSDEEPDDRRAPGARSLAGDNDMGMSLAEIADVIECELDMALAAAGDGKEAER
jgi:hypothetical protein